METKMSRYRTQFSNSSKEAMQDALISGLNSHSIWQQLLENKTLDF